MSSTEVIYAPGGTGMLGPTLMRILPLGKDKILHGGTVEKAPRALRKETHYLKLE